MAEKRMSTRYRGERPPKRQLSPSPPPPPRPTSSAQKRPKPKSPSPVEEEEGLPTSLRNGQNLPTLAEPQPVELPFREYRGLAESGVLAASVERSRRRWLQPDCFFEVIWKKPPKRKSVPPDQAAPLPPGTTMSKLGTSSMTISPHVFEVTLYTVKRQLSDPTPAPNDCRPLPPPLIPAPMPVAISPKPPVSAHSGASGALSPSSDPFAAPSPRLDSPGIPGEQEFNQGAGFRDIRPSNSQDSHLHAATGDPFQQQPVTAVSAPATANAAGSTANAQAAATTQASRGQAQSTDPVIQMLAARASSDSDLKSLMKIVAQGDADPAQLKRFQTYIDELHAVIKERAKTAPKQLTGRPWSKQPNPRGPHADGSSKWPLQPYGALQPFIKQEPSAERPLQSIPPVRPKNPSIAKSELVGVAFDINGGNGDRYLLPKLASIKYHAGNTRARLTFLATRYGRDAANSTKLSPDIEYYQPIEIRFESAQARVLEPIGRVLESAEEVQRHDTEIMDRAKRADRVYLATRLPRPLEDIEKTAEERKGKEGNRDAPFDSYQAPDSLLPMPQPARTVVS